MNLSFDYSYLQNPFNYGLSYPSMNYTSMMTPLFGFGMNPGFSAFNSSNFNSFNNYNFSNYNNISIINPFKNAGSSITSQFNSNYNFSTASKNSYAKIGKLNTSLKSYNTKSNLPQLAEINYNSQKANKLASTADKNALGGSIGYCAKYVKNAISKSGLGSYEYGHAYAVADTLGRNNNFKEINISGRDLKNLPAGCVIVYNKGDAGYSSSYGHVEITLGSGKAASDFVNGNIKSSDKARVFVPV